MRSGEIKPVIVVVCARVSFSEVFVDAHADDPEQLHNGVVKGEVIAHDFVGSGSEGGCDILVSSLHKALVLRDNALKGSLGKLGALVLVKVDVGNKNLGGHG